MVREPMLVPVIDPKVLAVQMLHAGGSGLEKLRGAVYN